MRGTPQTEIYILMNFIFVVLVLILASLLTTVLQTVITV